MGERTRALLEHADGCQRSKSPAEINQRREEDFFRTCDLNSLSNRVLTAELNPQRIVLNDGDNNPTKTNSITPYHFSTQPVFLSAFLQDCSG